MLKKFNLHSQQKRILALILLVSFIFCVLLIRLGVVQLIDGAWLQSKAQDQWTRDLPLKAERGKIYDSTGSSLAVSYTTYNIYTRAREIENPKETATYLSNLLGLTYQSVYNKVTNKNQSEFLIKMQVEEELARDIIDKNLKGVWKERYIHPMHIFKYDNKFYVTAFCELRNDIRHFEFSRIKIVEK